MKRMNKSEDDQQSLPSNVHKVDAALEFIKHVCAVFSLDQNVQHDVLVIFHSYSTIIQNKLDSDPLVHGL